MTSTKLLREKFEHDFYNLVKNIDGVEGLTDEEIEASVTKVLDRFHQ